MSRIDDNLTEIIKKIKSVFKDTDFAIVGSTALWLQGIRYKEPHDIDLTLPGKTTDEKIKYKRYFNILKRPFGFSLDILATTLSGDTYTELVSGNETFKVQDIPTVIKYKIFFSESSTIPEHKKKKHKQDLEELKKIIPQYF